MQEIQPVAPNRPLDDHYHAPGDYCRGCHELMGTYKPEEDPYLQNNCQTLLKQIVEFIRQHKIEQGDQYGSCMQVSPDAEQLAKAIEERFGLQVNNNDNQKT